MYIHAHSRADISSRGKKRKRRRKREREIEREREKANGREEGRTGVLIEEWFAPSIKNLVCFWPTDIEEKLFASGI